MIGTVIATTASGSRYVLVVDALGVKWWRLPAAQSWARVKVGWQARLPRVVPGEPLFLDALRSTAITDVAFIPASEQEPPDELAGLRRTSRHSSFDNPLRWLSRLLQS